MSFQSCPPLHECYDTVIVGGGPVGLFGVYYAGLRDMNVHLIDRRHELGGQITAIYPEKWLYDLPGIPAIRGKELYQNLLKQTEHCHHAISLNEEIKELELNCNDIFCLKSSSGNTWCTKTVILCVGMGEHQPRKPEIENLHKFEGKSVFYGVQNLNDFKGKKVLVVGGGDSALDLALTLMEASQHITLIHRSDRFNAHEETVKRLYASNIQIKLYHELFGLEGQDDLEQVILRKTIDGQSSFEKIECDAVVVAIGLIFNLDWLKNWGLEMTNNSIKVNDHRQTSIPGIYAAGDIATYSGKMKLIGTGAAEVMQAIHHAKDYIQKKFPFL